MKKNAAFLSFALAAAAVQCAEIDGVVARVGTRAILKSEVHAEMTTRLTYQEQLASMIERLLILKAAEDSKMTLQDWVVKNRIDEIIKSSFGGDRNALVAALSKNRMSYAKWCTRIREDMIIAAMRWQTVDKNVDCPPSAMRMEYMNHPEKYRSPQRVTVSVVLLSPDKASKKDEVLEALSKEPFADVARRYSSDSRSSSGGKWENVVPHEVFKSEVCDEIAKMPKGTLSEWLEIDGWCFLIRLDDVIPAKNMSFAEAYDKIELHVRRQRSEKLYKEWIDRLKRENYIKVY